MNRSEYKKIAKALKCAKSNHYQTEYHTRRYYGNSLYNDTLGHTQVLHVYARSIAKALKRIDPTFDPNCFLAECGINPFR